MMELLIPIPCTHEPTRVPTGPALAVNLGCTVDRREGSGRRPATTAGALTTIGRAYLVLVRAFQIKAHILGMHELFR
jgi:hypothetical protein